MLMNYHSAIDRKGYFLARTVYSFGKLNCILW